MQIRGRYLFILFLFTLPSCLGAQWNHMPDTLVFTEYQRHIGATFELKDKGDFDAYTQGFQHLDSATSAAHELYRRQTFTFPPNWSFLRMAGLICLLTGELHSIIGDNMPLAVMYSEQAEKLLAASGNVPAHMASYYYLGSVYRKTGRPEDALGIFRKLYSETDNPASRMDAALTMMEIYLNDSAVKDLSAAEALFDAVDSMQKELKVPLMELNDRILGQYYFVKGQYDSAAVRLGRSVEKTESSSGNIPLLVFNLDMLIECHLRLRQVEEVDKYYHLRHQVTARQGNEARRMRMQEERLRFEDARRRDLEELRQEREKVNNLRGWLTTVGITATSALFIVLLLGYRRSLRRNRTLSERNQKIQVLNKEIHHRVKNSLQMLQSMLRVQSRALRDPEAIEALSASQSRVQSLSMVHQELFNLNTLDTLDLGSYLPGLIRNFAAAFGLDEKAITIHIEPLSVNVETASSLGLLINELLTNTHKYGLPSSGPARIQIDLRRSGSHMLLTYRDNGPGFADIRPPESWSSLGMQIISSFTAQLSGTMSIRNDGGAVLEFDFLVPTTSPSPIQ